jgi:ubiquitin carboxyl-terminal hydrolase 5/13
MSTLDAEALAVVNAACERGHVAKVTEDRTVFKDECCFSFDAPTSEHGVYVNTKTLYGFGRKYVALDSARTGCQVYVRVRTVRTPKEKNEADADATPTTLGFGVDGGFASEEDKFESTTTYSLVLAPNFDDASRVLPMEGLPEALREACEAVAKKKGFHDTEETKAWQEIREVSKYSLELAQEDNGKKIPSDPSKWRCEETGDTGNLWVNLSDGHIGSGRKHFDGTGGNGSALRHYEAMKAQGKHYPLVVKLGTISANGADVYSYAPDEDDMVEDPYLAEHLRHWGINMMSMEKTEKSMAELQIELNKGFEFDKITEAGSQLESAYGPRLVGLKNMGNTCYLNSILQVLKQVPAVCDRYFDKQSIFESAPEDPVTDFPTQMSKLVNALVSDEYASPEAENAAVAVCPRMLKQLVGKGHPEFSTGRQQDAVEYFQHLLDMMTRAERAAGSRLSEGPPTAAQFLFDVEDKLTCVESGNVRYSTRKENVLSLEIPLDRATNKASVDAFKEQQLKRQKTDDGVEEVVRPEVPFSACLEKFADAETIEDFHSSALGRKSVASKIARMKTMPNFLAIQLRRYYVGEDWTPKKLDVLVDVPKSISLEHLRGTGLQPGEVELPKDDASENAPAATAPARVEPDMTIVSALMAMGFSENGSKRAALATNNASTEVSMEWVFAHMEDPDFNDPLPEPGAEPMATTTEAPAANPESIMMLASMGFDEEAASAALKACSGSLERAADWLFSHSDNLQAAIAEVNGEINTGGTASAGGDASETTIDGAGDYELFGIVSHMGGNTNCGHYVAHVEIDGKWYIFNDRKVALSRNPPTDLGYLYVFRRK